MAFLEVEIEREFLKLIVNSTKRIKFKNITENISNFTKNIVLELANLTAFIWLTFVIH